MRRRHGTDWVSSLEICGVIMALLLTLSILVMMPTQEDYAALVDEYRRTKEVPGYVWFCAVYFGTLLAFMSVAGLVLLRHHRRYRRNRPLRDRLVSRCPSCGYDTRASREPCPECGKPIATGWMAAQQEQDERVRSGRA